MRLITYFILITLASLGVFYTYKNSKLLFNNNVIEQQTTKKHIETLYLKGSNTIGEDFAPLLAQSFLRKQGAILINQLSDKKTNQTVIEGYLQQQDKYIQINIEAHGSTTGFKALADNTAEIAMSSRAIKNAEKESLINHYKKVNESPIALDALAIVTFVNNPIDRLTIEELAKIFSGEITNWKDLGGLDLSIQLLSRDDNSGTWDTFKSLVLNVYDKKLSATSLRLESSNQLVEQVINTEGAIGFVGVSYIDKAKLIAISKTTEEKAAIPSGFTIGTQNYPLSRKLFLYTTGINISPLSQLFLDFCSHNTGQKLAENVGLVSYYPTFQRPELTEKNIPLRYQDLLSMGNRVTVDFSLGINPDLAKEVRDIQRLQHYIEQNPARKIVLVDFSNNNNSTQIKQKLEKASLPVLDILKLDFSEREKNQLEVWIL